MNLDDGQYIKVKFWTLFFALLSNSYITEASNIRQSTADLKILHKLFFKCSFKFIKKTN